MTIKNLFIAACVLMQASAMAQSAQETEIRNLEQLEIKTVQLGDTVKLRGIWSTNFIVNNPYGQIVTRPQIFAFIAAGKIDYSSVVRNVDRVSIIGNVAICMGTEVVTPQNATEYAGKKETRQYTNIWMKEKFGWRLTARQATIVSLK